MATRLMYTTSTGNEMGSIIDVNRLDSFDFNPIPLCSTSGNPSYITHSLGVINALAKDGSGNFYIGTEYTWYDGVQINKLAKWNGTSWSSLGTGPAGGTHGGRIYAMCRIGNYIYMAGLFTSVSGTSATNIIRYDTVNNTWTPLGSGLDGQVYTLATDGTNLYAGGAFSSPYTNFAKWDGSVWSNLGSPSFNGTVRTIRVVSATEIYVGGEFSLPAARIAKWDGAAWSTLGSGIAGSGYVTGIVVEETGVYDTIYVCGTFTQAAGNTSSYIMKWYNTSWSAMGTAPNGPVDSIEWWNGIYAVGSFTTIGGVTSSKIAKWNGSAWSASCGNGIANSNNQIYGKLFLDGSQLYVYGWFTGAGGMSAMSLARFAAASSGNSAWARISAYLRPNVPMDDYYNAASISCMTRDASGNKYIGGNFTTIGGHSDWMGVPAKGVAKWNGSAWSALGTGITDPAQSQAGWCMALLVNGTDLYAGGIMSNAGGVTVKNIAKWNGSAWSALGTGPIASGAVQALAFVGTTLYAGLGSVSTGLEKWNGSTWTACGSTGLDDINHMQSPNIAAFLVVGTDLWIAGSFGFADGMQVNNIVKWNGTSFVSAGSGNGYIDPYDTVNCLAYANSTIYAGGSIMAFNNFVKLSGTAWVYGDNTTFTGVDGPIYTMVPSPSNTLPLYLGGDFTNADPYGGAGGPIAANKAASWNGTTWTGLGTNSTSTSSIRSLLIDTYTDSIAPTVGGSGTLTTSNVGYNSLTLSWTKASDNTSLQSALSYRAYYSLSSAMTTVANIEANGTPVAAYATDIATINVTGLSALTTYYLNVIVRDEAGNKAAYTMKTQATTAIPDTTSPVPGNSGTITKANVTGTSLDLNWTAATDETSSQANLQYLAYYSLSSSMASVANIEANGTAIGVYTSNIITKPVTGLTEGNTYYFNVIVKDVAGNKAAYSQTSQLLDATAPTPGASGIITPSNVTESNVTLTWAVATDNVTSQANLQYLAYKSSNPTMNSVSEIEANGVAVGTWQANITTKDVALAQAGTTYYFNVIVKDEMGNKAAYAKLTQATADTTSPSIPSPTITPSNIGYYSVDLSWQKATDNVSQQNTLQYLVYYSTSATLNSVSEIESNGTPIGSYTTDIGTKSVTGMPQTSSSYYFNVIVKDPAGNKAAYSKVFVMFETTVIDGSNSEVTGITTWGSPTSGLTLTTTGIVQATGRLTLNIANLSDIVHNGNFIEVKEGGHITFKGKTVIVTPRKIYKISPV